MAQANDTDQLPLKGIVLCCTSLAQDVRTKIATAAIEMGAVHKLDLTSDVTHLLVGNIETPKYRYVAKERPDIRVLRPDFVRKVNERWTAAEEVDVEALEKECTLPPFFGLHICLTGFEDLSFRQQVQKTVEENGGKYDGDLTKKITHLIVARPEGEKYRFGKQWGIRCVGPKWFEDSLQRGMAVDESLYGPEVARQQQGVGAFRTVPRTTAGHLGKRTREDDGSAATEMGRKKLRKSASMRLAGHSQSLWDEMSQHEMHVEATELDVWQDAAKDESQAWPNSTTARTSRRSDPTEGLGQPDATEPDGLFSGYFVLIQGFDPRKVKILRKAVESNGAVVVSTPEELQLAAENLSYKARCVLVPHAQPTELPNLPPGTIVVTEWWVERCIHSKRQLDPDADPLSQPLADALVPAFRPLKISATGFDGVDVRQTAEAIELMGAVYQEDLSTSTSVLICASESVKQEKALFASKHGIPAVSKLWLWECLRSKKKAPVEAYKVQLPTYDPSHFTPELQHAGNRALSHSLSGRVEAKRSADDGQSASHPKRLSNTRKRHATLALSITAGSRPSEPAPRKPRPGPFVHEDDDDDSQPPVLDDIPSAGLALSRPETHALKELSPNTALSPSQERNDGVRQVADSDAHGLDAKPPTTEEDSRHSPRKHAGHIASNGTAFAVAVKENCQPPQKPMHELTSDLASIVYRKSSTGEANALPTAPQKRKHRPLGRNLSGTSLANRTGSASASPAFPGGVPEGGCAADGYAPSKQEFLPPPNTQLGYDDDSSGIRVASVGTVKDSEAIARSAAMGARKARTTRAKG